MSSLETNGVAPLAKSSFSRSAAAKSASAEQLPLAGDVHETFEYLGAAGVKRRTVVCPDADELRGVARGRARATWVPLASMVPSESRLATASQQVATSQQMLARSLVKARGHGDQADVETMVAKLSRLPLGVLMGIQRAGISFVVCRGGVTDYLKALKDKPVRGHPAGDTWDTVPGTAWGHEVVIATMEDPCVPGRRIIPPRGVRQGSYDLVLHELGHALVRHFGQFRGIRRTADTIDAYATRQFLSARAHDWNRLPEYFRQGGTASGAGADESFAESFARYYGSDPTFAWDWPSLYRYWIEGPPALSPALAAR